MPSNGRWDLIQHLKVKLCLSLRDVNCLLCLCIEFLLPSFNVFYASKKRFYFMKVNCHALNASEGTSFLLLPLCNFLEPRSFTSNLNSEFVIVFSIEINHEH